MSAVRTRALQWALQGALIWGGVACSSSDACKDAATKPSYLLDNPAPIFTGADLTLTGTLTSDVRLRRVEIEGLAIAGTDNYSTWKVTIPASVIEKKRIGKKSTLVANALDVCGNTTALDPVIVRAEALSGVPAPGLAISLTPPKKDCYLPADGSALGTISITADEAADAVRVTLSPSGGVLLGARDSDHTVLLAAVNGVASATAFLGATEKDTRVSVAANAGETFKQSDSYPVAVAPVFSGQGTTSNGAQAFVSVASAGRFRSCTASAAVTDAVTEVTFGDAAPKNALNLGPVAATGTECGQSALFAVEFPPSTPVGAVVRLQCVDTLNQSSSFSVTSTGDPP